MSGHTSEKSGKTAIQDEDITTVESLEDTSPIDMFASLEATLDEVAESNPRLETGGEETAHRQTDLRALLEISLAITSSLVIDDVLQMVMHKAIDLMQAERGLIMLLDDNGELQVKSAYNLCQEEMMEEDFRISGSITSQVARSGRAVYASDAQSDDRYADRKSVQELHLRSIMCVPLIVQGKVLGVIYLDNSNQAKMFLKSDLYLFELYAQMVSNALHNANMYDSLLALEQFNKSVVDNSPVGIVVIDSHSRVITMNPVALEIFDINRDSISDDNNRRLFLDILQDSQRTKWQSMITRAFTSGEEFSDPRYYHHTGYLEKVLSMKISPLPGLPNQDNGLIMALEDVTSKVTMEQYVILSEKLVARGEMAASVAHELNNYLAIISNNAELLALNLDKKQYDKANFNSTSIVDNVMKIKRFVESLMDFSKPETEYISYDIRRLMDDLLFSMRIQPRFKLIQFSTDFSENIPPIEIDVGQIQQVLMNLLNNSADAIDERREKSDDETEEFQPTIGLTASWNKTLKQIEISVSDNGVGMSEETLGNIFGLHFSTKKGGHGLGLYNCKQIAEQHGGTLTATAVPDEGSTFTLILPDTKKKTNDGKP